MDIILSNCIIYALKIENGELGFAITMPLSDQNEVEIKKLGGIAGTENCVSIQMEHIDG